MNACPVDDLNCVEHPPSEPPGQPPQPPPDDEAQATDAETLRIQTTGTLSDGTPIDLDSPRAEDEEGFLVSPTGSRQRADPTGPPVECKSSCPDIVAFKIKYDVRPGEKKAHAHTAGATRIMGPGDSTTDRTVHREGSFAREKTPSGVRIRLIPGSGPPITPTERRILEGYVEDWNKGQPVSGCSVVCPP
jgi:hypothetical protein